MSRMYLTMFLMGILYAAFVLILWSSGVGIIFVGIIAGVILAIQYFMSEKLVLRSTGAREVTREQEPGLYAMVERLAETAGLPMPKLAIIDSPVPNAFATGRNPQHALVVVTTGIRQRLTDRELNAVLAHELAHVTNRDMRMMAIASFFITVASFLMQMFMWRMMFGGMFGGHRGNQGGAIMGIFLVTILVYFIGSILMKSLSRYREFGADHGGAELTGDPGALASALEKISGSLARIPSDDLRKLSTANAFMIIPALRGDRMGKLLSTHPAVEDRVARLRAMEREMPTFLR